MDDQDKAWYRCIVIGYLMETLNTKLHMKTQITCYTFYHIKNIHYLIIKIVNMPMSPVPCPLSPVPCPPSPTTGKSTKSSRCAWQWEDGCSHHRYTNSWCNWYTMNNTRQFDEDWNVCWGNNPSKICGVGSSEFGGGDAYSLSSLVLGPRLPRHRRMSSHAAVEWEVPRYIKLMKGNNSGCR